MLLCLRRTQQQAGGRAQDVPLLREAPVILGTEAKQIVSHLGFWQKSLLPKKPMSRPSRQTVSCVRELFTQAC